MREDRLAGGFVPARTLPDQLLLKDYQPRSIYRIPETEVLKARFAVIDVHSHAYAKTEEEIEHWVQTMDAVGIETTIVLTSTTGAWTPCWRPAPTSASRSTSMSRILSGCTSRWMRTTTA